MKELIIKIKDAEHFVHAQMALFSHGYKWYSGTTSLLYLDEPPYKYLITDEWGAIIKTDDISMREGKEETEVKVNRRDGSYEFELVPVKKEWVFGHECGGIAAVDSKTGELVAYLVRKDGTLNGAAKNCLAFRGYRTDNYEWTDTGKIIFK